MLGRISGIMLATLALVTGAAQVQAQQPAFPTKPITLIVPFAPGGATDIVARLLSARMSEDLGQNIIIDNRTGGGGNVGTAAAARSAPDGYTLVLATTTQLVAHYLFKNLNYDLFNDLVPVAMIADAPELMVVSTTVPGKSLKEFAEAARASPNGFNFGSAGLGSVPHLGGEVVARAMGAKMVHVPYRGSADAMKEVASGNIQFTLATHASAAGFVEADKAKVLAVAAKQRLSVLPDVPTTAEAGFPGIELSNWFGIMAPRGISPELVARLNSAFNKALAHPSVEAALKRQGIEPVKETPQQFANRLQADAKAYKQILDQIGLAPQ